MVCFHRKVCCKADVSSVSSSSEQNEGRWGNPHQLVGYLFILIEKTSHTSDWNVLKLCTLKLFIDSVGN